MGDVDSIDGNAYCLVDEGATPQAENTNIQRVTIVLGRDLYCRRRSLQKHETNMDAAPIKIKIHVANSVHGQQQEWSEMDLLLSGPKSVYFICVCNCKVVRSLDTNEPQTVW